MNGCAGTERKTTPKDTVTQYRISGTVLDSDNNPIEKARVTISAVQEEPMITEADGTFLSGSQAKSYKTSQDAVIIIQATGYTYEGYEEGKALTLGAPKIDLGRFRLFKISSITVGPCEIDSDGDGYNDCIDNCIDEYNPDQDDCKEGGIEDTRIPPPIRYFGIQILPEDRVDDIFEIYIDEKRMYNSNDLDENYIEFTRNIFYTDGTSVLRNIQLIIEDFAPDDVDFNDSKCNDENNFLKLVIQKDGKIKKIDCR
jgi:hypothetical protein